MRAQTMTSIGARWISTDPDTRVGLLQAQACNMRSKCRCSCVLQFTFCHAFSSVLHRPPSQLIHCIALFLLFRWKRKKKLEKLEIAPSVAGLCCTFVYSNPGGDCHRAERRCARPELWPQGSRQAPGLLDTPGHNTVHGGDREFCFKKISKAQVLCQSL